MKNQLAKTMETTMETRVIRGYRDNCYYHGPIVAVLFIVWGTSKGLRMVLVNFLKASTVTPLNPKPVLWAPPQVMGLDRE